jgi:hypothetical protein
VAPRCAQSMTPGVLNHYLRPFWRGAPCKMRPGVTRPRRRQSRALAPRWAAAAAPPLIPQEAPRRAARQHRAILALMCVLAGRPPATSSPGAWLHGCHQHRPSSCAAWAQGQDRVRRSALFVVPALAVLRTMLGEPAPMHVTALRLCAVRRRPGAARASPPLAGPCTHVGLPSQHLLRLDGARRLIAARPAACSHSLGSVFLRPPWRRALGLVMMLMY